MSRRTRSIGARLVTTVALVLGVLTLGVPTLAVSAAGASWCANTVCLPPHHCPKGTVDVGGACLTPCPSGTGYEPNCPPPCKQPAGGVAIGACGNPNSTTTTAPGGPGKKHYGNCLPSICPPPPPPPPPPVIPIGSPTCTPSGSGGQETCTQLYGVNPVCNNPGAKCGSNFPHCKAIFAGFSCTYSTVPGHPGSSTAPMGTSANPGAVMINQWWVNYNGQTYGPYGQRSWSFTSGAITAVCNGTPTQGTMWFTVGSPSGNPYKPPNGYVWNSPKPPPPPATSQGYQTTFTVPACNANRQAGLIGVSLAPAHTASNAPTTAKNLSITANGQRHDFYFRPTPRCDAAYPNCGADTVLTWNGGTATVLPPYSPTVNTGSVNYRRWTPQPLQVKCCDTITSSIQSSGFSNLGTSSFAEPYVPIGFHAPSSAGSPYVVQITGSYTASWHQLGFYVSGTASYSDVPPPSVTYRPSPRLCLGGYAHHWVPSLSVHLKKGQHRQWEAYGPCLAWEQNLTLPWSEPAFSPSGSSVNTILSSAHTHVFSGSQVSAPSSSSCPYSASLGYRPACAHITAVSTFITQSGS